VIVATAGHIDHGKSLLVRALTGVDTDRLPEEKARGLTIDLGFAYLPLPGAPTIGFIDVPGHERFIRNMLAGVAGIDFALLVVAADDGVMPQTVEHLAVLDLLGLTRGAVAVTKIDRVDANRVAAVERAVHDCLSRTGLATAQAFPVSAITGAGVDDLRAHLEAAARHLPPRLGGDHFRLAVDRSFVLEGTGLVATGTVFSGEVRIDDRPVVIPSGVPVRVRGIHAQSRRADRGTAGDRCALNLTAARLDRTDLPRGSWLVSEPLALPAIRLDARLRVLASEPTALGHWTPIHVHHGAASLTGRIAILGARQIPPGGTGLVQIILDSPTIACTGDRFVVRDQSARRTIGGGTVIDPFGPARSRGSPARLEELSAMDTNDATEALRRLAALGRPSAIDLDTFARARNLSTASVTVTAQAAALEAHVAGNRTYAATPRQWAAWGESTLRAIADLHEIEPAAKGFAAHRIRSRTLPNMQAAVFDAVLAIAVGSGTVSFSGGLAALAGRNAILGDTDAAWWRDVEPMLSPAGQPAPVAVVAERLGVATPEAERFLVRLTRHGLTVRLSHNRFLARRTVADLAETASRIATESGDGRLDLGAYRKATGLGRNLTIEVLEYFDRRGLTRRDGNARRVVRAPKDLFGDAADQER
jgi:selenocysteine-specific elongation factor